MPSYVMSASGQMLDEDGIPFARKMMWADERGDLADWSKWYHKLDDALKARVNERRQSLSARVKIRLTRAGAKRVMSLGIEGVTRIASDIIELSRRQLREVEDALRATARRPELRNHGHISRESALRSITSTARALAEERKRPGSHMVVPTHDLGTGVRYEDRLKQRRTEPGVIRIQERVSARRRTSGSPGRS